MNVVVTMANGEKSYPIYEPSHRNSLVLFYTQYVIDNPGSQVVMTDDNDNVVLALVA